MNRSQLPRSAHLRTLYCSMIAAHLFLSHLRTADVRCAHVSTLPSDARIVALSGKQSQSFPLKRSSHVPNAARNALSFCLAPDLHQKIFLFIRFTSLSPRGGIRRRMVKPIVREQISCDPFSCAPPGFLLATSFHQCRTSQMQQPIYCVRKGNPVSLFLVPVYRMHQPTLVSPCILGDPCYTCSIHAYCLSNPCKRCRQGERTQCERAYPAPPAFVVRIVSALQLVRDGAAVFIHQNNALQLTFAKLTYLRDISSKINGTAIWEYAAGSKRVRIAVDLGWRTPVATVSYIDRDQADLASEAGMPSEVREPQQMYSTSVEV